MQIGCGEKIKSNTHIVGRLQATEGYSVREFSPEGYSGEGDSVCAARRLVLQHVSQHDCWGPAWPQASSSVHSAPAWRNLLHADADRWTVEPFFVASTWIR